MKTDRLIYFAILILLFSGCKKDDNEPSTQNNEMLGTWQYVLSNNVQDGDWMYTKGTHTLTITESTMEYSYSYDLYQISNPTNTEHESSIIKGSYSLITADLVSFVYTYSEHNGVENNWNIGKTEIGYYNINSDIMEWAEDFCEVYNNLSGNSNTLQNSSFYSSDNNNNNYTHYKLEFTENELKKYEIDNNSPEMPTEWGVPYFEYEIEIHENYYKILGSNYISKFRLFENKLYIPDDLITLNKQ